MDAKDALQALDDTAHLIEGAKHTQERAAYLAQLLTHTEAIAEVYRTHPEAFQSFALRVGSIRGMVAHFKAWTRPIKARAKEQRNEVDKRAREASRQDAASLDSLTEELGCEGLMSPPGYRVDPSGIWDLDERIALEPIVMTGVTRDLETDALRWDLAWRWRDRWWKRSVERHHGLDARRLLALAEYGLPVHSDNSARVVRYLADLEAANLPLIEERATTGRCGWLADRVFQLGEACHGSDCVLVADGGLRDLSHGWTIAGTWEGWRAAIRRHLRRKPLVQLAMYASAAAPLLAILEIEGFIVDWSGATSRGKTTALRVASSIWGDPESLVGSWGTASVVGPQETAAFLRSLPVILDDTKRVTDRPEIVARMLYDLPAGRERLRGQAGGGLRRVRRWRTVMLSTGEKAVTDFSEDAGARARCLCIRGAPFGKDTTKNRESVEALTAAIRVNHGHLGAMLIARLVSCDHGDLRARWSAHRDRFAETAGGSVSRRLSASVAALALAGDLLHELGCPGAGLQAEALDDAWSAAQTSGQDSDRPAAAWRALYSWCEANAERFDGARRSTRAEGPSLGWAGRWDRDSHSGGWDQLGIYPMVARKLLDGWGFDRDYVINEWGRRGLLNSAPGRLTKRVRLGGSPGGWLFVFDREAVAGLLDD